MAKLPKLSWRKILGEVFLIFVAINLSIWFNNWNERKQARALRDEALVNIEVELSRNVAELQAAHAVNRRVVGAYQAYRAVYGASSEEVVTTPATFAALRQAHGDFFRLQDSVALGQGQYRYRGTTFINLDLPALSAVAWETTLRFPAVGQQLQFSCLYELGNVYALQAQVIAQTQSVVESMQTAEADKMMAQLDVLEQLSEQLLARYQEVLKELPNCSR